MCDAACHRAGFGFGSSGAKSKRALTTSAVAAVAAAVVVVAAMVALTTAKFAVVWDGH